MTCKLVANVILDDELPPEEAQRTGMMSARGAKQSTLSTTAPVSLTDAPDG